MKLIVAIVLIALMAWLFFGGPYDMHSDEYEKEPES